MSSDFTTFKKVFIIIYSSISILFVFLGTILSNELVWELTDFFNYLMVIPNAIALIALSRLVVDETKEASVRKKKMKAENKKLKAEKKKLKAEKKLK